MVFFFNMLILFLIPFAGNKVNHALHGVYFQAVHIGYPPTKLIFWTCVSQTYMFRDTNFSDQRGIFGYHLFLAWRRNSWPKWLKPSSARRKTPTRWNEVGSHVRLWRRSWSGKRPWDSNYPALITYRGHHILALYLYIYVYIYIYRYRYIEDRYSYTCINWSIHIYTMIFQRSEHIKSCNREKTIDYIYIYIFNKLMYN